ncbi:MAG: isoprenylcysteine carboxylmethyltransferase family protein [Nitrosomonadales bacterium]|nr:isoprenylcysteine carboxylmethyltransferase family protein [Nitrosomonadales bacterium]
MREGIIFFVATLGLAFVSRASLRKPGSHGFYRFFAWECMLGIFVLNMRFWHVVANPTHQLISGLLFSASLLLVLFSLALLQLPGKPDTKRDDVPLLEFEKTTTLVTSGIYRYIRHPMYASLLFLCWGFFFKQPSLVTGVLAVTASGLLVTTARVEEIENIRYFGEEYQKYMKRTKMFVPYII